VAKSLVFSSHVVSFTHGAVFCVATGCLATAGNEELSPYCTLGGVYFGVTLFAEVVVLIFVGGVIFGVIFQATALAAAITPGLVDVDTTHFAAFAAAFLACACATKEVIIFYILGK